MSLSTWPVLPTDPDPRALAERLIARTWIDPDSGCFVWQGNKLPSGYGRLWFGGRQEYVHRASFRLWKGEIPAGLEIDHWRDAGCTSRACWNPHHLRAVTHAQNLAASPLTFSSINASKTHCKHGHPFDAVNTYHDSVGRRSCRECRRIGERRNYGRRRDVINANLRARRAEQSAERLFLQSGGAHTLTQEAA